MRTLVHLSDLHFGRVDMDIVAALTDCVNQLNPQVIAVSGDLTQRAKVREFEAARRFLGTLSAPKVIVPGNHDIPLYNLGARFLAPLARYRRFLSTSVESEFVDEEIVVVGVNTARSNVFKGGRINIRQIRRVRELYCRVGKRRLRVLVTHHPFHMAGSSRGKLLGRADLALSLLFDFMPDILLAGHVHAAEVGTTAERYDLGGRSALVVQAGTATSCRTRDEHNSFNVLQLEQDAVTVLSYVWNPQGVSFVSQAARRYVRRHREWVDEDAPSAIAPHRG